MLVQECTKFTVFKWYIIRRLCAQPLHSNHSYFCLLLFQVESWLADQTLQLHKWYFALTAVTNILCRPQ